MDEENKRKFTLWAHPETLNQVKRMYQDDNCRSQSEFIEQAIHFYCGYLSAENNKKYLPNIIISTLQGIVDNSDNRLEQILFKIAVELSITMNVVAATNNVEHHDLQMLRARCISDIKKTNGMITFDDAVKFQKG